MTIDTDDVKNKVIAGAKVTGEYIARTTPKLVARLLDGYETFKTAVAEEQAKLQKEDTWIWLLSIDKSNIRKL